MTKTKLSRWDRRFGSLERGDCLQCFGGKDAPDPPNYSAVAAASERSAEYAREIAQEQLAWAREQWADQKDMIGRIQDVQLPIMEAQIGMAQQGMNAYLDMLDMQQEIAWENQRNAMQDRDRYERIFQPIEEDLVTEFMSYDTEGRRALEAGRAQADVARAQEAQRQQQEMRLADLGVDPSQIAAQGLDAEIRTQMAADQAAAGNQARQNVENVGRALRAEAINIGRGQPSNVAASYGTALAAGQGAQAAGQGAQSQLGNTMSGLMDSSSAWQGAGGMLGNAAGWQGLSNQAVGQWGNTLNMGYQNQLAGWQAQQASNPWNTIAGIAGAGLGMYKMFSEGGEVEGPGDGEDDLVAVRLSNGEFVVPEDVVRRKGTEFFDKLIAKTQEDIAAQDAEMQQKQQRAQVRQQALQMPQMPPPGPQQPMMAEGGEPAQAKLYSGRNQRPMFGYSSKLAQEGQRQANQATADRQALMERLRTEIQNKAWKQVEPSWQPTRTERETFDIRQMIEDARARRKAEEDARANQQQPKQEQQPAQNTEWDQLPDYIKTIYGSPARYLAAQRRNTAVNMLEGSGMFGFSRQPMGARVPAGSSPWDRQPWTRYGYGNSYFAQ